MKCIIYILDNKVEPPPPLKHQIFMSYTLGKNENIKKHQEYKHLKIVIFIYFSYYFGFCSFQEFVTEV